MNILQIIFLIYSIVAVFVFLALVMARKSDKVTFEYSTPDYHAAKALLTEYGLFAFIGLLWPLFLIGAKMNWGKKD